MSSTAILPQLSPTPYRFSFEEYHKLGEAGIFQAEDRVELLDGEISVMSPHGIRHAMAVSWITESLVAQARRRYLLTPGNPVWLHEHSEPRPDMMLIPRVRNRERHSRPEDVFLLAEVSDTSLAYDRGRKLSAYAQTGVREYWIVKLEDDRVEVSRQPSEGKYPIALTFAASQTIHPLAFPDVAVAVADSISPR
jgi:Uma2 family endonuclease